MSTRGGKMDEFNKFDIRENLGNAQRVIFQSEKLLEEGSYPRQRLYFIRVELSNVINYLNRNPEYCPG